MSRPRDQDRRRDQGAAGRRPRRWWMASAATLLMAAVAWWYWPSSPQVAATPPPSVDLESCPRDFADQFRDLREQVVARPASAEAWGRLGMLLMAYEYFGETTQCFEQAIRLAPTEFRWHYLLGIHLAVLDPERAERTLRKALEIRPGVAVAHVRLGELLMERQRFDDSAEEFKRALDIDRRHLRARLGQVRLELLQGAFQQALDLAQRVADAAPTERAAIELLANAQQLAGESERALETLAVAEQLPESTLGWQDDFAAAALAFRRDPIAVMSQAETLGAAGRGDEAVALLQRLLARDQSNPASFCMLARLLLSAPGGLDEAERLLVAAQRQHPRSAEVWFQSGVVSFLTGQYDLAAERFRQAIALRPNYALAHFNLGHTLLKLNDSEAACSSFRQAIDARPYYVDAHLQLARTLRSQGKSEEARTHLDTVLRLDPGHAEATRLLNGDRR